ncbi:MAG: alpha/beta hydrolase fold domain-containing protein [Candidatus Hodarchaeota archaeon]
MTRLSNTQFKMCLIFYTLISITRFGCQNSKKSKECENYFWSHKFFIVHDMPYVDEATDLQKLDLYLQGEYIGEPNYVRTDNIPHPTLIYIHGGGFVSEDKSTRLNYFLHFLERGWHVVNLNYSLGEKGKEIEAVPPAVDDVMVALKRVVEHAEKCHFDLNNIVISGESAGGTLALLAGLYNTIPESHNDYIGDKIKIRAIINWFGVTDFENVFYFYMSKSNDQQEIEITDEKKEKYGPFILKYSPVHCITENAPPILTIHGNKDTVVPIEQATILHDALNAVGVRNKLLILEGGKHVGFTDSQWRQAFSAIFEFLNYEKAKK